MRIAHRMAMVACLAAWGSAAAFAAEKPAASPDSDWESVAADLRRQAGAEKLQAERLAVAEEFAGSQLLEPRDVARALKILNEAGAATVEDNIARTTRALAEVDRRFAEARKLVADGKHAEAAAALKALLPAEQATYRAAAVRLLLADALVKAGRPTDAADAYRALVREMPGAQSFASAAAYRLAQTYESLGRMFYAVAIYRFWILQFGMLDPKETAALSERVARLEQEYKDPLATVAGKMDAVGSRLTKIDSGQDTQKAEREILALLDDMIKTAEESQQQSGQGQGQGQGQGRGAGMQGAGGQGPPQGVGIPSSPATRSALVGGETVRPHDLSTFRPSDASDDWGKLKPRERQALIEALKELYPERYREMLEAYYKSLSEAENRR